MPAAPPPPTDKAQRLAQALRDNLRRRKASDPPRGDGGAEERDGLYPPGRGPARDG